MRKISSSIKISPTRILVLLAITSLSLATFAVESALPDGPKRRDYATYSEYAEAYQRHMDMQAARREMLAKAKKDEAAAKAVEASAIAAAKALYEREWEKTEYNIDLLKITLEVRVEGGYCESGVESKISLQGQIGPDSSFVVKRLIERHPACKDEFGNVKVPMLFSFNSGGGLLIDGYSLGQLLRSNNATTIVEGGRYCASSCAVAFLGGKRRIVRDGASIMFHAPYFSGKNEYGKRDVNCDVGEEALTDLKKYYQTLTDSEAGERLFERTMWYCSAEDGWVVTGGGAAELYGIATER